MRGGGQHTALRRGAGGRRGRRERKANVAKRLKHVTAGVIGLGIGRHHLREYASHPKCTIGAICDADAERLGQVQAEYGLPEERCFTSTGALMRAAGDLGLDAVSVALPNALHAPVTIAALRAGLHVLCEKPMAMTARQGERMIAAAKKAKRTLGLNLSFRFVPQSRALKDMVDAGRVGDVYYAHTRWWRERGLPKFGGWFGQRKLSGGGPVIDLGVHRMDLAMWLMGNPEPSRVSASTYDAIGSRLAREQRKRFDVEDFGAAFVRFTNGASLVLEASWAGFSGKREDQLTEILGTRGGIVQRNLNEGYEYEASVYSEENGTLTETVIRRRLEASPSAYAEFVDALVEGREPLAPALHGLQVQRVLDGIYRSARMGREVKVQAKA